MHGADEDQGIESLSPGCGRRIAVAGGFSDFKNPELMGFRGTKIDGALWRRKVGLRGAAETFRFKSAVVQAGTRR